MQKSPDCMHSLVLFKEQTESFCEYLAVINQSRRTISLYRHHLKLFFAYLWRQGIDDLREVTKDIIRDYEHYVKTYNCEDGHLYSTNTIIVKIKTVRRLFEYLEKTHQILYNPAVCIKLQIKTGQRLPKNILTKEEAKKILDQPNTSEILGIRDKTILELLYSSGIRLGELSNLTIYDIDYKNGFLRVHKGKCAKDRILPLGQMCCRYLREYIQKVRPLLTRDNKEERALFIGKYKQKLSIITIEWLVRKYAKEAGITKKVSTHTWRHTFASHLLADGADILHVQKLLGHVSPRTTQIYTRVTPLEAKQTHNKHHPREKEKQENPPKPKKGLPCQGKYQITTLKKKN